MAKLEPGSAAPDIRLPDQNGEERSLASMRGQWVLVYFYPRDDTPGCTIEACGLRDAWSQYARAGIQVFGISADGTKSHRKFADKYALPFTLLADEEKKFIRAYGAWGRKKFMGREFDGILRQSFLVDPRGRIAKVYPKVKPEGHAEEVLADVAALKSGVPAGAPAGVQAKPTQAAPGAAKAAARPSASKVAPKAPQKTTAKPAKPADKAAKKATKKVAKKAPSKPRGTPQATRKSGPKG